VTLGLQPPHAQQHPVAPGYQRLLANPEPPPLALSTAALPQLDRRTIRRELVVVILVFPAVATVTAIITLVAEITGSPPGISIFDGLDPTLAATLRVVYLATLAGPIALVWYLLGRSGLSFKSIGLDRTHIWRDLLAGVLLMIAVHFLSAWIGDLLRYANAPGVYGARLPIHTSKTAYIVTGVAEAVLYGVMEEVVVLGYLTNRLRGLRWSTPAIAIVSVILRGSYHAEYGIGVLEPLVFGALMTLFYLRTRRLLPVIIGHIGYDVWVTLQVASYL